MPWICQQKTVPLTPQGERVTVEIIHNRILAFFYPSLSSSFCFCYVLTLSAYFVILSGASLLKDVHLGIPSSGG